MQTTFRKLTVAGRLVIFLLLPTLTRAETGVQAWVQRYDGPANAEDQATAVAVDGNNDVIITGYSASTVSLYDCDYVTIKYICVPSPVLTNLSGSNSTFQMQVDDVLLSGTLVIEASTDLVGWVAVLTNTTPTNVLFYTDPDAGRHLRRFYRAYQFP